MCSELHRPLVAIVDDDADTRELYRMVLESVGYVVADRGLVATARTFLADTVPDVLLTDWLLPDGTGLEVCQALHDRPETRHVPVIAISGLTLDVKAIEEARSRGVVAVLEKPVAPDAMLAAIRAAVLTATGRRLRAAATRAKRYLDQARRTHDHQDGGGASPQDAVALLDRVAARSGDAIMLMIADDRAHYVAAAGAARDLTGYEAAELAQLSLWDISATPEPVNSQALWNNFIAAGTQEGEYLLRRRDGTAFRARYCALANIAPGWHVSAITEAPELPGSLS